MSPGFVDRVLSSLLGKVAKIHKNKLGVLFFYVCSWCLCFCSCSPVNIPLNLKACFSSR